MNKITSLILILIVIVFIIYLSSLIDSMNLWRVNKSIDRFTEDLPKECPPIVDPKTFENLDFKSKRGQKVLKQFLVFHIQKYLEETKDDWNYILPTELNKMNKSKIFILDVRKPEDFNKDHIKGSTNIFWLELMKPENLKKLPKDKKIVLICYVGHTSSQILVLLKLLGYDVVSLKFGLGKSPTTGVPVAGWIDYDFPLTDN